MKRQLMIACLVFLGLIGPTAAKAEKVCTVIQVPICEVKMPKCEPQCTGEGEERTCLLACDSNQASADCSRTGNRRVCENTDGGSVKLELSVAPHIPEVITTIDAYCPPGAYPAIGENWQVTGCVPTLGDCPNSTGAEGLSDCTDPFLDFQSLEVDRFEGIIPVPFGGQEYLVLPLPQ
jgi:hypothetical protein